MPTCQLGTPPASSAAGLGCTGDLVCEPAHNVESAILKLLELTSNFVRKNKKLKVIKWRLSFLLKIELSRN